jgi:hypothetical protein
MRSITSSTTKRGTRNHSARSDRVTEANPDFNIQLRVVEHAMKEVFELDSVDVTELTSGDDFHIGHQEGWVEVRVCYACVDLSPCDADLV